MTILPLSSSFSGENPSGKMSDIGVHSYIACTYSLHDDVPWFFGISFIEVRYEDQRDTLKLNFYILGACSGTSLASNPGEGLPEHYKNIEVNVLFIC